MKLLSRLAFKYTVFSIITRTKVTYSKMPTNASVIDLVRQINSLLW